MGRAGGAGFPPSALPLPPHPQLSLCKPRRGVCPCTLLPCLGLSSAGCRGCAPQRGSGGPAGEVAWLPRACSHRAEGRCPQTVRFTGRLASRPSRPASGPGDLTPVLSHSQTVGPGAQAGRWRGAPSEGGSQGGVPARQLAGGGRGWAVAEAPGPCAHPLTAGLPHAGEGGGGHGSGPVPSLRLGTQCSGRFRRARSATVTLAAGRAAAAQMALCLGAVEAGRSLLAAWGPALPSTPRVPASSGTAQSPRSPQFPPPGDSPATPSQGSP